MPAFQFPAPAVNGGVFCRAGRQAAIDGAFNDFSGIVFVWNDQVGNFKMKGAALLAFQPSQTKGLDTVRINQLPPFAVTDFYRSMTAGTETRFSGNGIENTVPGYDLIRF